MVAAMLGVLLSTAVACDPSDASLVSGPPGGFGNTSTSSGTHPTALVGRWSHTEIFTASDGSLDSSQTIWELRSDGSASRTVIARNVTDGIADQVVATGTWETNGQLITVTFAPPDSGTAQFSFSLTGSTLTLNGLDFTRIA